MTKSLEKTDINAIESVRQQPLSKIFNGNNERR